MTKEQQDLLNKILKLVIGKSIGEAIPVLYGVIFAILDIQDRIHLEKLLKIVGLCHDQMIVNLMEPKEKG